MAHILYFFSFSTHLQTTKKYFQDHKKSQVASYTSSDEHLVRERGKEREREGERDARRGLTRGEAKRCVNIQNLTLPSQ